MHRWAVTLNRAPTLRKNPCNGVAGICFVVVVVLPVLPGNTESIEHAVGACVATITIYGYSAAPDVNNAEIKGLVVVVYVPCSLEIRIDVPGRRACPTCAI